MQINSGVSVQPQNGSIPTPKLSCSAHKIVLIAFLFLSLLVGAGGLIAGIVLGCLPLGIIGSGVLLIVSLSALALKTCCNVKKKGIISSSSLLKLMAAKNRDSKGILNLFHKYDKEECPHMLAPWSENEQGRHSAAWAIPGTKVTLISSYGNISEPAFLPTQGQSWMVVNSTNKTGDEYQLGTGSDLYPIIDASCWYHYRYKQAPLKPGDCIVKEWSSQNNKIRRNRRNTWDFLDAKGYLCHVCSPTAQGCKKDPNVAFDQLKTAYTNCFTKAYHKGCKWIQLPLLAGGDYTFTDALRKGIDADLKTYKKWEEATRCALLTALAEFGAQHPNYPMVVVLVDKYHRPL